MSERIFEASSPPPVPPPVKVTVDKEAIGGYTVRLTVGEGNTERVIVASLFDDGSGTVRLAAQTVGVSPRHIHGGVNRESGTVDVSGFSDDEEAN